MTSVRQFGWLTGGVASALPVLGWGSARRRRWREVGAAWWGEQRRRCV